VRDGLLRAWDVGLGILLLVLGLVKVCSGYDPRYALGIHTFYCSAIVEVVVGLLFLLGTQVLWACIVVIGIGAIGIWVGLVFNDQPCGCFGSSLDVPPRLHVILAGCLGLSGAMRALGLAGKFPEAGGAAGRPACPLR